MHSSLSACRSFCVLLIIASKSHSFNSFSLSMIRMLLFAENRIYCISIHSNLHLQVWGFGDSPLWSHLKSCFCQDDVADPMKTTVLTVPSIFLQTILLLSIFQWFNMIIYSLNMHRLNHLYDTMCINWDMDENKIFYIDGLNMHI